MPTAPHSAPYAWAVLIATSCGLAHDGPVRWAEDCCTCVAGVWSPTRDCTLPEGLGDAYAQCAQGSGLEDAWDSTRHHLRSPDALTGLTPDRRTTVLARCTTLAESMKHPGLDSTRGLLLLAEGDHTEALVALASCEDDAWLTAHPALAQEHLRGLARAWLLSGAPAEAESTLARAVSDWELAGSDTALATTLDVLAQLHEDNGSPDEASSCRERATSTREHRPVAALEEALRSLEASDSGAANTALEATRRAMEGRQPGCPAGSDELGARLASLAALGALRSGDTETATATLKRIEQLDPNDPSATVIGARLALDSGHHGEAREALEAVVKSLSAAGAHSSPAERYHHLVRRMALTWLGWSHEHLGQMAPALEVYEELLERDAEDVDALLGRARALVATGQPESAGEVMKRLLDLAPGHPEVLVQAGITSYQQGLDVEAEAHFLASIAQGSTTSSCPYEGLGLVYLRQGRTQEAKESLEIAIGLAPGSEHRKYKAMARILMEEGDLAGAERMLIRSLEIRPDDPEVAAIHSEQSRPQAASGDE